ncbi:MAG: DEAD/DEAH box helicase, partial [Chloroflexota bacterium]
MSTLNVAGRAVRVAVEALADRPERTFTYLLPASLEPAEPGSLVLVPYGPRAALGYLMDGPPEPATTALREVEAVVSGPILTPELLVLAEETSAYYRAPIGATLAAMLPPGLESRLTRRWLVLRGNELPPELATSADADGRISDAALQRYAPRRGKAAWLDRLRRSGVIRADWTLEPPEVTPRRVRVLRRVAGDGEPPRRAPVQRALLEALGGEERTLPELAEELGVALSSLLSPARRLAELGLAELEWRTVERDPLAHRRSLPALAHDLAPEQASALEALRRLPEGGELLLEGVAASGKTDVYLAAVEEALAAGRTAIVLVPETSLIPQLADRLRRLVGDELAVLHSGLSAGERHDGWWRILRGEARVVVGTRTAAFAPLDRLGLIVLD